MSKAIYFCGVKSLFTGRGYLTYSLLLLNNSPPLTHQPHTLAEQNHSLLHQLYNIKLFLFIVSEVFLFSFVCHGVSCVGVVKIEERPIGNTFFYCMSLS